MGSQPTRMSSPAEIRRRFPVLRRALDYLVALVCPLLVILIVGHWPSLQMSEFMLLTVGVMVSAWLGGLLPGLVSTAFGSLLAAYWLLPPYGTLLIGSMQDVVRLSVFDCVGIVISLLTWERNLAEGQARTAQEGLKAALLREQDLSRSDFLTNVPNRRAFYELIDFESKRARRSGSPLTLAYIDVDDFKWVNDIMGHVTGDDVLIEVAATLKKTVRQSDVIARMGGDEFAILLPDTDSEDGKTVIEKVQGSLLEAVKAKNLPVTFSIGAVTFVTLPSSVDDLVRKADALMYNVKHSGKNRVAYEIAGV